MTNAKTAKADVELIAAPATYPQTKFDTNLPAWTALIQSGKKIAEAIIKNVSLVAVMTELQKATILAIRAYPA